ncbi:helix-turn-helix domain-containing protein [Methylacidiphilales bacterium]|nr:helix-turn-helix domain-containing protein [Candidatus Methylacidiphilales bacterium]
MTAGRPPKYPQTKFGKKLMLARKEMGITQIEMAKKLGITQRMYTFWERRAASIPLEQIEKLVQVLDISANDLFTPSPSRKRPASKTK